MALSQDIVSQFAKLVDNKKEEKKEETIRGTYKKIGNVEYVQLDGSNVLTPVESTVEAETGDRVQIMIKDHYATVTGNITDPAARSRSVKDLADTVDEHGNTIQQMDNTIIQQGNSIIQMDNTINQQGNTLNQHNNAINQQNDRIVSLNNTVIAQGNSIEANSNSIIAQGNIIDSMNNTITEHGNNITSINNTIQQHNNRITQNENTITQQGNTITQYGNTITQQGNIITQQGNTITQQGNTITQQGNTITEQGSNITILNSAFTINQGVLTGLSAAIIDKLKTDSLDAAYAKIDFANINMTSVGQLFAKSGIINDLVVGQSSITGELVGVTLKGDLIEANSLKADKLVVKGSDGLYYKLNIDGMNNISTTQASKFTLTDSEPSDWSDSYTNYYIIQNGNYVHVEGTYTLISSEPSDWSTKYKNYYIYQNNEYVHVTGDSAPAWASNTYYKLVGPSWSANTYYKLNSTHETGLDGTVIVAQSVTADKIQVTDLVAFGATIGGFIIGNTNIHTIGKDAINSNVTGIYMDKDGQIYIGDDTNGIKFYKDSNDQWHLEISASTMKISGHSQTIAQEISDISATASSAASDASTALTTASTASSQASSASATAATAINLQYNFIKNTSGHALNQNYIVASDENGTYDYITKDAGFAINKPILFVKSTINSNSNSYSNYASYYSINFGNILLKSNSTTWYLSSSDPSSSSSEGKRHFNTSTGKHFIYTNGSWTDLGYLVQKNKTLYAKGKIKNQLFTVDDVAYMTEIPDPFNLTTSEPDDWSDNYEHYFLKNEDNEYVHISNENAPTWIANTYYEFIDDGSYYMVIGYMMTNSDNDFLNYFTLQSDHPIYKFIDGQFVLTNQIDLYLTQDDKDKMEQEYQNYSNSILDEYKSTVDQKFDNYISQTEWQESFGENGTITTQWNTDIGKKLNEYDPSGSGIQWVNTMINAISRGVKICTIKYQLVDIGLKPSNPKDDPTNWVSTETSYSSDQKDLYACLGLSYTSNASDITAYTNPKKFNGYQLAKEAYGINVNNPQPISMPYINIHTNVDEGYSLELDNISIIIRKGYQVVSSWENDTFSIDTVVSNRILDIGDFEFIKNEITGGLTFQHK